MTKPLAINSAEQFSSLLKSSKIVIADFYADWCGPCHQIAPVYEEMAGALSRPNQVTFTKINVDQQQAIAQKYEVTGMPTFVLFKNGAVASRVVGADPVRLSKAVEALVAEAKDSTSGGDADADGSFWLGASLPKGYSDVTEKVDKRGLDLLNVDSELSSAQVLFDARKPSALNAAAVTQGRDKGQGADKGKGKGKERQGDDDAAGAGASKAAAAAADWVESDTDQQMMLYMPFTSTCKIHSLQFTSIVRKQGGDGDDDDDGDADPSSVPTRPKTIRVYPNRTHVLGFDEAEDIEATQTITLSAQDWDAQTSTARVELRFVKFQNVSSLVLFVVDGEDEESDKVRLDRIRIIGEAGDQRQMGKLEKIKD